MTRPEAIEAAAEAERAYAVKTCADAGVEVPEWGSLPERERDNYRDEAGRYYGSLAPHIESALLDRIEAAVKRLRDEETSGPDVGDHGTYGTIYGLDAVLATLTELREEGK